MKFEFNKLKGKEALASLMEGTVDLGKKAAVATKNGLTTMIEKTKASNYARRMRKYNPLFPEQYNSEEFHLPNIIMIVDDAIRRDVDVCKGAIGWLDKEAGVEILFLYDEAVKDSGLQFIPTATCDAIYYVDSFNRKRFIRTDYIFGRANEERVAELKHIAYCLGAKRCAIEISESSTATESHSKSVSLSECYKGITSSESMEESEMQTKKNMMSGQNFTEFKNNDTLQMPELKWFAQDDNINRLIEICLTGKRVVERDILILSGSSCATMSRNTARAIDSAIGNVAGASGSCSMDSQVSKESQRRLFFYIEF